MMEADDILYEDEPFHGVTVKAASIDKLVEICLNNFIEGEKTEESERFVSVFFKTYHWYLTTEQLIQRFVDLYDDAIETNNKDVSSAIIDCVRYWLDYFGPDFEKNENVLNTLSTLNSKIVKNQSDGATQHKLNLDEWYRRKEASKPKYATLQRRSSLNFNELPAEDIAKQIIFLSWKGVKKVPIKEWMIYGKSAKTKNTPLLKDQIGLFNDVSKYAVAMILNRETAVERAKSVQKFVSMSQVLLKHNDFNTLLAVMGGLGHSAIIRLQKTKELLSNSDKLFIKETHELLSSNHNYSKYRSRVAQVDGFLMPVLGVVMKDLVALETAVKDHVKHNEENLINFHKMVLVSEILEGVINLRYCPPNVEPDKELVHIMRLSLKSRYTEDDLHELSAQREPRSQNKQSTSSSPGLENLAFSNWAAGITQETPDRTTVEKYILNMVDAVFKTYDVDKNGSINKDEFDALATNFPFIDSFAVVDVNCDGDISRHEMLNYFMNVNSQEMTKEFLHEFQEHSFYSPTYCVYCMGFLWGIGKSGYRCKDCQIVCHKDCKDHVVMECRPHNRERSYTNRERSFTLRDRSFISRDSKSSKKKRLRDLDWHGSSDSVVNESLDSTSSGFRSSSETSSTDFTDAMVIERLKERITRLEMEKIDMKKENSTLKSKLSSAEKQVESLQSQLEQIRPLSVKFMLEQLERLSTCKETDL